MNILISGLFLSATILTFIAHEPIEWWLYAMSTGLLSIVFLQRAFNKG